MNKKHLAVCLSTLGIAIVSLGSIFVIAQPVLAAPRLDKIDGGVFDPREKEVVFIFLGSGDFYQVRYPTASGETQVKVSKPSNSLASFTIKNARPNSTYTIKAQACESHFLARSVCTPWQTSSATMPPLPKPYGVDTCNQGYVWREAQPNDRVCVTPAVRTQTRNENNSAAERREPNGGAYGPNTCKQGYVWRDATTNDPICVTPQVRAQAAEDNKRAGERRVP